MAVYVVFGGAWGAGLGGVVKLILLYAAGIVGLILVLRWGGVSRLLEQIKAVLLDTGAAPSAESRRNRRSSSVLPGCSPGACCRMPVPGFR